MRPEGFYWVQFPNRHPADWTIARYYGGDVWLVVGSDETFCSSDFGSIGQLVKKMMLD